MNKDLPKFFRLRQHFPTDAIGDVGREVATQIASSTLRQRLIPGQSVAITVGSRGIDRIAEIAAATVRAVQGLQGVPFIVPAMGSHGGATPTG